MARKIEIGETGSYGLFPKMRVIEVKNKSVVMTTEYDQTKEVSKDLFFRYFRAFG